MFRIFVIFILCLFAVQSQAGTTFKGGKISSSTSDSKTETGQGSAATSIGWKEFIARKGKPDFDGNKIVGCGGSKKSYKILQKKLQIPRSPKFKNRSKKVRIV